MELKKLTSMTHRMSELEATLLCWKCQKSGGMHRIHDGKAMMGKRTA
jgi:hypothetical protein